ncbi:unnamed protein product, partial [Laminaria digitata]
RYLRVRYEDVATSPELAVALIYCWSGLGPVPPSVSEWIEKLAKCLENTKEAKHNPYGTKRQSADMVSMWRTLMSEQDAQAVWEACEDSGVMDALGYDP